MQHEGDEPSQSYSDLALFIQSLANEGRAAVSAEPADIDDADAMPLLRDLDGFARDALALELQDKLGPVFDITCDCLFA